MTTLNIHTIVGARPQFIKAAALSRAISLDDRFKEKIINTDQHYDLEMSKIFFDELSIPRPHYSLGINGGPHGEMTGRMLINIEEIFLNDRPDAVIIYGDTNSTLAGALAAGKMHIPIIHIEAGLRSFNRQMPEEINRVLSDHISELLLCPTQTSLDNLANGGIAVDGNGVSKSDISAISKPIKDSIKSLHNKILGTQIEADGISVWTGDVSKKVFVE